MPHPLDGDALAVSDGDMTDPPRCTIGTATMTPADVVAVARDDVGVELAPEAVSAIADTRRTVDAIAAGDRPAYGVSTGFGALATRHIPTELRAKLQRSLIRSHAAGSGPEVEREVVRAMMVLRLRTLASGRTGVRVEVAQLLAGLLDAGITPVVHEHGSLGCSGDLAPLAHELADLLYVVYGALETCGLDADAVFAEVHRANMSKAGGPRRADGKLLKPPGWRPADVAAVLRND